METQNAIGGSKDIKALKAVAWQLGRVMLAALLSALAAKLENTGGSVSTPATTSQELIFNSQQPQNVPQPTQSTGAGAKR